MSVKSDQHKVLIPQHDANEKPREAFVSWSRFTVFAVCISLIILSATMLMTSFKKRMTADEADTLLQRIQDQMMNREFVSTDDSFFCDTAQSGQRFCVLSDHDQKLQAIKLEDDGDDVCFVTRINASSAKALQSVAPEVFHADDMPVSDWSQLGAGIHLLCGKTPTYWMHQMTSVDEHSNGNYSQQHHHRSARGVPKCLTSCCEMVCCCNQRFLSWSKKGFFSCTNICQGCEKTKMYRKRLC